MPGSYYISLSVVEKDGERHYWPAARIIGVRGQHLFIEQEAKPGEGNAMFYLPLSEVDQVTVDTDEDDDRGAMNADLMGQVFDENWQIPDGPPFRKKGEA